VNGRASTERATEGVEWVNIPELARRIGLSKEAVYRLARTNAIPGLVTMGRRRVVNYTYFVEASKLPITAAA
jgi:predicted DNA-binding transcriptional regulator AlpA